MRLAIDDAGLEASDIDYVNAHGTSTQLNDLAETVSLKQVFGDSVPPISSTKSGTGHLLGAAGAAEAIVSVCSITDNKVHATLNMTEPDPACDLDYISEGARELPVKHVLSNSFGFGGHNACLVFSEV